MRGALPAWTRPRLLAVTALCVALALAGCAAPGPAAPPDGTVTGPTPTPTTRDGPDAPGLAFDGARAFDLAKEQVRRDDGSTRYRVPGTEGNREVAQWAAARFGALGYDVAWHHFNATYGCEETWMHNVVATRAGTAGDVVWFAAHYDTRPVADKDKTRRDEPIAGAIDGASGVAVLLELARVLPPTNDTVRFVLFDGEDGGGYRGSGCTEWILGSTAYAATLSADDVAAARAFVVVDMVGDPDMLLPYEGHSLSGPGRGVQEAVYDVAHALGHDATFLKRPSYAITDDHVPFIERGIPAIDLIHLLPDDPLRVFPAWHHTHADDLDALDPASLEVVGRTLEAWVRGLDG